MVSFKDKKMEELFNGLISQAINEGNTPADYDTRPGAPITTTKIDEFNAGRPWTYQFCTQFGWYQTVSHEHPMRSALVSVQYYNRMC